MKSFIGGLLLLSFCSLMAQNNNNNNNDTTAELFKDIVKLPKELQCRILPYQNSNGEECLLFGISSISIPGNDGDLSSAVQSIFKVSNYQSIHKENNESNVSFDQIAHIRPINEDALWQNFGKSRLKSQYFLKLGSFPDHIEYDGPNPSKLIVANLIVPGISGTSKSLLYLMSSLGNNINIQNIEPVNTDTNQVISAIALAPNNVCAIAQKQHQQNVISFFDASCYDQSKPTFVPIGTPIFLQKGMAGVLKLMFLNAFTLYALCHDGNIYKIDQTSRSVNKQIFKDKNDHVMCIDQFALNPNFPAYGAFISNKKLYLVNMRKQKFVCKLEIPKEKADFKVGIFGHRQIGLYKLGNPNHQVDIIDDRIKVPFAALAAYQDKQS